MTDILLPLGVTGLVVLGLFWYISGKTKNRLQEIDRKLEAYEDVNKKAKRAKHASADSELVKRLRKDHGHR